VQATIKIRVPRISNYNQIRDSALSVPRFCEACPIHQMLVPLDDSRSACRVGDDIYRSSKSSSLREASASIKDGVSSAVNAISFLFHLCHASLSLRRPRVLHLSTMLASFILRTFLVSYSGVLENLGKAFKLAYAKLLRCIAWPAKG
jgi:hypothetical protein